MWDCGGPKHHCIEIMLLLGDDSSAACMTEGQSSL